MRTWDIAKILLNHCNSPEAVDQVLMTLEDPSEFRNLYAMLLPFATQRHECLPSGRAHPSSADRRVSGHHSGKLARANLPEPLPNQPVSADAVARLESLFRADRMTNAQVQQWMSTHFDSSIPVGKGSLHNYLSRVLNRADTATRNRIFAAALRLDKDSPELDDLRSYWDLLDKRSSE